MTKTLVQVGMEVVTTVAIFPYHSHNVLVYCELIKETVTLACLVIGMGYVTYGDALRTILSTNPICIRKVNAYGCRRIFVTSKHSSTDYVGCNAFYYLLAETWIYRRMVLKPLCVLADCLSTMTSLQILVFHDSLPWSLDAERVAIYLYESVYEVDVALKFL